jgi:hypothetical protein
MTANPVSKQTSRNWSIDAALFISTFTVTLTGIYFLYLPAGGFQGGRNPMANVQILFNRHTWDDLHTWSGVILIAIAGFHLARHWNWFTKMIRKSLKELVGKCNCLNPRGVWNLILNILVAISFLLTSISGVYFLFFPGGRSSTDPMILLNRFTWDMIHTWSGVALIIAALVHFAIHWKWITKVAGNLLQQLEGRKKEFTTTDSMGSGQII